MMKNRFAPKALASAVAVLALLLLLLVFPAAAQDSGTVTDDDVNAIAKQMYCPVCENIPLDVCGTAACIQWRADIKQQLESGRTPEQVMADFVARYGDRVVGTPQDPTLRALSLVTPWLIGALAVLAAGVLLLRWWRGRGTLPVPAGVPSAAISDDDYRTRLERDVTARR